MLNGWDCIVSWAVGVQIDVLCYLRRGATLSIYLVLLEREGEAEVSSSVRESFAEMDGRWLVRGIAANHTTGRQGPVGQ